MKGHILFTLYFKFSRFLIIFFLYFSHQVFQFLLFFYICFHISRCHFSQLFRNLCKIFSWMFLLLADSLNPSPPPPPPPPPPAPPTNIPSMAKICYCKHSIIFLFVLPYQASNRHQNIKQRVSLMEMIFESLKM